MKILNAYILKQLLVGFAVVLIGMTVLVWLTQSLKMVDMIVTKGVGVGLFLKMTFLVLPNFIQILSPLALFSVVLFVYSRMQSDKELMVMRAVGMSNFQLMKAPLIVALFLVIIGYAFTLFIIPYASSQLREMKWQVRNNLSHLMLQEGQFNSFKNGLTIYVKERLGDGVIKGIVVYDAKNPAKTAALVAESGIVFQDNETTQVVFQKGVRQEISPDTNQFSILKFDKYTMLFDDKKDTPARGMDESEYSLSHLIFATPTSDISPVNFRKFKVEAMNRLLQPLYNLTFVFLAVFGVLAGFYNRRGTMGQVNFVIILALIVQSLALAFKNMATKNLLFMPLMPLNALLPILLVYLVLIKGKKWKIGTFKIGVFLLALGLSMSAFAAPKLVNLDDMDKDKPVDFESDAIEYDKKGETLTALGNVVVTQNGIVMKTEKLIFNRKKNQSIAPGKVTITMPDGSITTTEGMTLTDGMNNAIGDAMTMQLFDGTYITAASMKRADRVLYLKNLTYTPCDRCETKAPWWQLRARKMKHDANTKTMVYRDTFLDVKGVPVFYFPYLEMPDFSVKRKTGFLSPSLAHNSTMGSGIQTPFFIDLADNQNLTITPTITTDHVPLGLLDYNGVFQKGAFNFQGSGTKDDEPTKDWQGHVKADFEYDLNDEWRTSGQLFRASSDTYFRRYRLEHIDENQSILNSNITAERFGERNYANLSGLSFQSLRAGVNSDSIPLLIPTGDFQFNSDPLTENGLYAFSEVNGAIIHNRESFRSDRISVTQGMRLPYVTNFGAVFDTIGSVRMDGYTIDTGDYAFAGQRPNNSYSTGRVYPNLSVESSYPMAATTKNTTQVFKPIIMGVVTPAGGNNEDKIPDTDSLVFDFDDTNLFSRNRYAGYDRVETGTRVNYGAEWSVITNKNAAFSTLLGQSYNFTQNDDFAPLMGSGDHFSDYVGRVKADFKYVTLAYRFRMDQSTLENKKNEITLTGGGDPLRLGIDYVSLKEMQIGDNMYPSREEILLFGSSRLTKKWSLSGLYRYDLAKGGGPIEVGSILRYDNECTAILFDLNKSFTEDRDYRGDTSFMVKFILKTLGGGV